MMEYLSESESLTCPRKSSSPALAYQGGRGSWYIFIDIAKDPGVLEMESSSTIGTSKRARAPNNGSHVVSCLVDGCISDLSKCKEYNRRHKVCEVHSKTATVIIRGQEQRFCQQCSRFHSLPEFDDGKRSCRKRLDGHNRRRRKPQPDSLSFNSGSFLSTQHGARYMPFSSPQIFPTTTIGSSSWDNTVKQQNDPLHYSTHQQLNFSDRKSSLLGSFPQNHGGKQFPFLQHFDTSSVSESSVCQPPPNHLSTLKEESSSRKLFPNRSNKCDRVLSLLSYSPPAETRPFSLDHIMQPNPPYLAQSSLSTLQYSAPRMDNNVPVDSTFASNSSNNNRSNMYCQEMFQIEPDESAATASHQTISFSWE